MINSSLLERYISSLLEAKMFAPLDTFVDWVSPIIRTPLIPVNSSKEIITCYWLRLTNGGGKE